MRFDVLDGAALELNVSGLQPDTKYSVQVAALTRKGDGDRSQPVSVKTPGGVPNRPTVNIKYEVSRNLKRLLSILTLKSSSSVNCVW